MGGVEKDLLAGDFGSVAIAASCFAKVGITPYTEEPAITAWRALRSSAVVSVLLRPNVSRCVAIPHSSNSHLTSCHSVTSVFFRGFFGSLGQRRGGGGGEGSN